MPLDRRMRRLPLTSIHVTDPFWGRYLDVLVERMLPHQYQMLVETNRLRNLEYAAQARLQGSTDGLVFEGRYFNDSDVYKWVEAAAYALIARPNHPKLDALRQMLDSVVGTIAAAQEDSGYINSYFQLVHPDKKWMNLNSMHEMYCGGHLIAAGVAHREATGSDELFAVAIRFADHVASIFGPGKRVGSCGHQEIEIALIKLAAATGNTSYRELAAWMVESRGRRPSPFEAEIANDEIAKLNLGMARLSLDQRRAYVGEYLQDHAPIREHDRVVGHAVRAMYFYTAAADLCEELDATPNPAGTVEAALKACWENLTQRRMYVTGGIGPSGHNEGFTIDYDLPNRSAYAETCAAIGLCLWGRELMECSGDSSYADVVERALYNGVLSGVSLGGDLYFYENPLDSHGEHQRTPWFDCACCPPNVARLIGQIGQFAMSQSENSLWLHIPIGLEAQVQIGGAGGSVRVEGSYPNSGSATMKFSLDRAARFAVRVRLPDWCDDASIEIDGHDEPADFEDGYAVIEREWRNGDSIAIDFEMNPRLVQSHPRVLDNAGRLAVMRGPLVYCGEEVDLGFAPHRFTLDAEGEIAERWDSRALGGVHALVVSGWVESSDQASELYATAETLAQDATEAKLVPYYAWQNRGPSRMLVWFRST